MLLKTRIWRAILTLRTGLVLLLLICSLNASAQFELSKTAASHYYLNPVISGMNPDPSICRVGEDYYLVTSTFGFYPGLPIYHSRDLVHWKHIGYGIHDPDQLKLRKEKGDQLNLFAATMRYHDGTFYIINTNVGRKSEDRNFIITASNPAGPWSEAHYIEDAPRIDPSLFFDDDGKVYYTGNDVPENPVWKDHRTIWSQEIDLDTWKLVGPKKIILDPGDDYKMAAQEGKPLEFFNHYEGPHIYKKDNQYYLLVGHGGTFWNHSVSMWRSDSLFGPYEENENNPIVTNRDYPKDNYIHHTGHADMVETQNGEWWMVLLGSRPYGGEFTNLGRETALVPVDWTGDWPVINPLGPQGRVMPIHRRPELKDHDWDAVPTRDDFEGSKFELYWNFMQAPVENWWSLSEAQGQLRIALRPIQMESYAENPSFIGRRQQHKNFTVTTKMKFLAQSENESAGLLVTRDVNNQFQFLRGLKDDQSILQLIRREVVNDSSEVVVAEVPLQSEDIYLKIDALEQEFQFSYSLDGQTWNTLARKIDGSFLSFGKGMGRFTGTFIGMYATSRDQESDTNAFFDWFEYSGF